MTNGGSGNPGPTALIPGAFKETDPGYTANVNNPLFTLSTSASAELTLPLNKQIYTNFNSYTVPGPAVFSCNGGGSNPSPSSSSPAPAQSSTTSKAATPTTTTTTKAPTTTLVTSTKAATTSSAPSGGCTVAKCKSPIPINPPTQPKHLDPFPVRCGKVCPDKNIQGANAVAKGGPGARRARPGRRATRPTTTTRSACKKGTLEGAGWCPGRVWGGGRAGGWGRMVRERERAFNFVAHTYTLT